MAKAVSPISRKGSAAKSSAAAEKPRTRSIKSSASPPVAVPPAELLAPLTERLNALEEKLTAGFSTVATTIQGLQATPAPERPEGGDQTETFLPIVADLIRRSLTEHLTPITAALKRLEERIGFVSNRLKHAPGGQERQKPWRHDQPSRSRSRRHGAPRPGPGQPWTAPSAASVQGHFAPRPLRNEEDHPVVGDEEE
ncbi:MAG TPA: hypothetical protein VGX03_26730 [Candidatus Binatia bacterium]|jgi:hypothetical protein|nr:hypothetical protein [Candidatus Binatia bacterium]